MGENLAGDAQRAQRVTVRIPKFSCGHDEKRDVVTILLGVQSFELAGDVVRQMRRNRQAFEACRISVERRGFLLTPQQWSDVVRLGAH